MLRSIRPALAGRIRLFSSGTGPSDAKPSTPATTSTQPSSGDNRSVFVGQMHQVSNLDKKMLVWVKRYKTIEEIPAKVTIDCIEKARSKARIKTANWMIVATIIGCFVMVISGKRARDRGESVHQMNVDWHNKINQEYKAGLAKATEKKD